MAEVVLAQLSAQNTHVSSVDFQASRLIDTLQGFASTDQPSHLLVIRLLQRKIHACFRRYPSAAATSATANPGVHILETCLEEKGVRLELARKRVITFWLTGMK